MADGPATLSEALPSPEQYNALRQAVGWGVYDEDVIAQALPQSRYSLLAYVEGRLVGMARVVGDGGMVYYVQDVIVLPEFQRQGIGRQLMDQVMAWVAQHAHTNTIVGLMAAVDKEPFYAPYGFVARPNERMGAGMVLFWPGRALS